MKVLHLNTYDIEGGAARGTYWLHKALRNLGVNSNLLVAHKQSSDFTVIGPERNIHKLVSDARQVLDNLPLHVLYPKRSHVFSPAWLSDRAAKQVQQLNPDIVNLHWVCGGFLTPETLRQIRQPIVWTIRDMWSFTGGCHYAFDCKKYEQSCGFCPCLGSESATDLSRIGWHRKSRAWKDVDFTIVAISHWLAECAGKSKLFSNRPIKVIHNALEPAVFKPISKSIARAILNLPQNRKLIAFGAINATSDSIKGYDYLKLALQTLSQHGFSEQASLVIFGSDQPAIVPDLGLDITYLGRLHDNATLALVYSAADVTVVPSIQEAFGKTAMEALSCGTPVVCFDSTGLKDIVDHQVNGYRARCFDSNDLASGIAWVLQDDDRWQTLSRQAREKVERSFTLEAQARSYLKLYEAIQSNNL